MGFAVRLPRRWLRCLQCPWMDKGLLPCGRDGTRFSLQELLAEPPLLVIFNFVRPQSVTWLIWEDAGALP